MPRLDGRNRLRDKPDACYESGCPLARLCRNCKKDVDEHPREGCKGFESLGRGFVLGAGDPKTARYAVLLEAPGREEVSFRLAPVEGRAFLGTAAECERELAIRRRDYPGLPEAYIKFGVPVVGATGAALQFWLWPKAGIKREQCYLDNTLRCLPPKAKGGASYPTGTMRQRAEKCCRQWDRLQEFRPDTLVLSLHPASLLRAIAPLPLVVRDFEKVRDFTDQGRRVATLLGGKAAKAFARFAENSARWRGHYVALAKEWSQTYRQLFEFTDKKARKKIERPATLAPAPCKSFKRYKGKSAPKCGCEPCWNRYEENKRGITCPTNPEVKSPS